MPIKNTFLFIVVGLFLQTLHAQTSYFWNGTTSTSWTTSANWTPNGVPGATDNVTIVSAVNSCTLNANQSVNNLTLSSGSLDLGLHSLNIGGGTAAFSAGTAKNGVINITNASVTSFGNTSAVTMNCVVKISSAAITFKNTLFQDTLTAAKTGATNDMSYGGNTFNGVTTMTDAGTGYFGFAGTSGDQFNNTTAFNNTGSSYMHIAYNSTGNVFNGVTYFTNTSGTNNPIYIGWNSTGTIFNNNIIVSSTSAGGIYFCGGSATANATVSAGSTISIGAGGFTAGTLSLRQISLSGLTPLNLALTGSAQINLGPSSNFNASAIISAPNIYPSASTFNNTVSLSKTDGTNSNPTTGGNIFNGTLTVNYTSVSGTGYWSFGNGSADIYNGDVYANNNSQDRIIFGHASANNQFNGNLYITQTGGSAGTALTWNTGASSNIAAGKTIAIGAAGFTAGYLYLQGVTQNGTVPVNLTTTGSSSVYIGNASANNISTFNAAFAVTAPDIYVRGGVFNNTATFTKTGGVDNNNNGAQNIFNSDCYINQQSNAGYFMLGYLSNDLFNGNIILTSTGNRNIYLGWYNGATSGNPVLAAGKTIQIGAAGYNAGGLQIAGFTQSGTAPVNLAMGGNATITFTRQSVIGGDLTLSAGNIYFNGATFNGVVNATKTDGIINNASNGGNVFNKNLTANHIASNGVGYWSFGNGSPDIYNGDVFVNNNSQDKIVFGHASTNNQFNGNVYVTQIGSSAGISLAWNAGATSVLAAGKGIYIGAAGFSTGFLYLQGLTQNGTVPVNLTTTGNSSIYFGTGNAIGRSSFAADVVVVAPNIYFNGATFNGLVTATKTDGVTSNASSGGNVFNKTLTVNHIASNGVGYWSFGNGSPDIYNNDVYANNNSQDKIFFGHASTNNQFNGNLYITQIGSSGGTALTWNFGATSVMAAGKSVFIGAAGFNTGFLYLQGFTQNGTMPVNLSTTGNASIYFGQGNANNKTVLGGDVVASASSIFFQGGTFNGKLDATKTGANNDVSTGGNIFNGDAVISNSGDGQIYLANSSPDRFNANATFNNLGNSDMLIAHNSINNTFNGATTFNNTPTGTGRIYVSANSPKTVFNGNIIVTSVNYGSGVQFCTAKSTASVTLSTGYTITVGGAGFTTGTLLLKQFAQQGTTAQNLALTVDAILQYGPVSSFQGDVTCQSPTIFFNGCHFFGAVTATKTGTTNDASAGSNIFDGNTNITITGDGFLLLGNTSSDKFNSNATFNNLGNNNIYVAHNSLNNTFGGTTTFNNAPTGTGVIYVSAYSSNTVFNGNIVVNSTNFSSGVQFCASSATAAVKLAPTYSISVGAGGFSSGTLLLRQFTQQGTTPQNITATGNASIIIGPLSSFAGDVTASTPTILFNGCHFYGAVTVTKTGSTNDASSGSNIFDGIANMTNAGSGYFMFANNNPDQFNASSTFNNTGSNSMYVANNSANNTFAGTTTFNNASSGTGFIYVSPNSPGTVFNGNVLVSSANNANGVYFCSGNSTATVTIAATYGIGIAAAGFSSGKLYTRQFTQLGTAAQSLTLTANGILQFDPLTTLNGSLTASSPTVYFSGSRFNGAVNCTKTGINNDASNGNNIFNGTSTFTNTGTGYFMMANSGGDSYNNDVSFVKTNSGAIYPNYNFNCAYAGNINVSSASAVTFGAGTGTATLNGTTLQNINAVAGTPASVFTRLIINNTGGGVTLNSTPINVSVSLALTSGLLNTTSANILTMLNGSTVPAGNALSVSYINGPMVYVKSGSGVSTLNFPVGNGADCRPVILTVNHANGNLYNYKMQLNNASATALHYSLPPTVDRVSQVHYYTIDRTNSAGTVQPVSDLSGNQTIQIFFGINDVVTNGATLTIVKNTYTSPTSWIDIGGSGGPAANAGAQLTGSITSTSSPQAFNSFSTFSIADVTNGLNVLPVELLYFKGQLAGNKVNLNWQTSSESNNNYFTVEKSTDGVNFKLLTKVNTNAVNGNSSTALDYTAADANPVNGNNFYRLSQTDINGYTRYHNTIQIKYNNDGVYSVETYPNPTTGIVYLKGLPLGETNIKVQWYDVSGRMLLQETAAAQNGIATLTPHLSDGVYLLNFITAAGDSYSKQIIIKK